MAYTITWDASTPDGAITPAADIDQEIQDLKAALGERLVQIMPEWADAADPKKIAIVYGDLASRPATPDFPGEMYFATDNSTLYLADATPAWVAIGGSIAPPEEGEDTGSATYFVAANKLGNQAVGGTSVTALTGWAVATGYGSWYSAGNPTRFTCPAGGTYELFASVSIQNVNVTRVQFRVNGTTWVAAATEIQPHSINGSCAAIQGAFTLVSGDYVELMISPQTSLPSVTVLGTYSHVKITRHP